MGDRGESLVRDSFYENAMMGLHVVEVARGMGVGSWWWRDDLFLPKFTPVPFRGGALE